MNYQNNADVIMNEVWQKLSFFSLFVSCLKLLEIKLPVATKR